MKNLEKFLEFNGKRISVLSNDGQWWVAIRPICDALGIEYTRTFKNLKEDDFFRDALAKQPTHDTLGRVQEMVCIRERDVYGWLCSLRSESTELAQYKRKCYDILYNHFHGALTARFNVLNERDGIALRILELEEKLEESEEYQEILELRKRKSETTKALRRLDVELKTGQLSMDFK